MQHGQLQGGEGGARLSQRGGAGGQRAGCSRIRAVRVGDPRAIQAGGGRLATRGVGRAEEQVDLPSRITGAAVAVVLAE